MASVLLAVLEGFLFQSRLAPASVDLDRIVEPLSRLLAEWLEI